MKVTEHPRYFPIRLKLRLRDFARMVRGSNMAYRLPETLQDSITEEEGPFFLEVMKELGLQPSETNPGYWERREF